MKKPVLRGILTAAASLAVASLAPLAAALFFRVEGPVGPLFAAVAVLNGVFFLRSRGARRPGADAVPRSLAALRVACTGFLALVYLAAAFILLVCIVVIPFSYYLAWLEVVGSLKHGGLIGFIFLAVTAWFSSMFGGLVYTARAARPAAGAAVVAVFELAVVFRTPLTVVLFTAAAVLAVALLALGGRKSSPRRLALPLGLVAASVGFAALFTLGSEPNAGLLTKTSLLSDIKRTILEAVPDLTALSSVSGYGFSYGSVALGRRPVLSNAPLLAVRTQARVVYVRTQVYDDYFNNNWGVDRFFADRLLANREDVLAGPHGPGPGLSFTVLFDYFPQLPHTLSASAAEAVSEPPVAVAGGNFDSGFDLTLPLLKGAEVRLFYPEAAAASRGRTASAEKEWGEGSELRPAPAGPERDKVLERYLVVPTSLTARIHDLARGLKGRETDPRKILANIRDWLRANCSYSLDTTAPPAGGEFLDDFLFTTRRGYCAHFATALAVLARCDGIPARYATGFLALLPPGGGEAVVTGLNAHAWPEAWIEGAGWVSLEATPAFDPGSALVPDYYRRFNRRGDDLTARQLAAIMGGRIPPPVETGPDPSAFFRRLLPAAPFAGAALLAAAAAVLLFPVLKKAARRRRVYRGRMARLNLRLCALVRTMERRGVAAPERTGWIAWGSAAGRLVPAESRRLATLARTATRVFFARAPVTKRHLRFARALSARVVRRLREKGNHR